MFIKIEKQEDFDHLKTNFENRMRGDAEFNKGQSCLHQFKIGDKLFLEIEVTDEFMIQWIYKALYAPNTIPGFENLGLRLNTIHMNDGIFNKKMVIDALQKIIFDISAM